MCSSMRVQVYETSKRDIGTNMSNSILAAVLLPLATLTVPKCMDSDLIFKIHDHRTHVFSGY